MAQDDYYYEIQLTNKQLVFYFMAGAAGLVLSFLAGRDGRARRRGPARGRRRDRPVTEERVVAEQSPAPAQATPAPGDFSYPQRLESDRPEEGLERSRGREPDARRPLATPPPSPRRAAAGADAPAGRDRGRAGRRDPAAARADPGHAAPGGARRARCRRPQPQTAAGFAIQVGAFKDRASADTVVQSLKTRGFPAYAVAPAGRGGGLFTVRVGIYRDRADAEAVQARLHDDKFKPYIIKQ